MRVEGEEEDVFSGQRAGVEVGEACGSPFL